MSTPTCPGYDVVEMLGFGAGGEVWLAREAVTGRAVALKRLRAGGTLADRDRLRREAAVLACIDHPHVVRLHEVHGDTVDGDAITLVLDLASGGSLSRLLAVRGPLRPGEVITLIVPLAEALATVHDHGLVHGDVTPANVLFAGDGRPVLSDLGMCRLLGVASSSYGGTPGFLDPTPEQDGPGPASDVFGLAATCLAALGPDPTPGPLADLLRSATDRDPAVRPTAAVLADQAFRAGSAEPIQLGHGLPRSLGGGPGLRPGPVSVVMSSSDQVVTRVTPARPRVSPVPAAPARRRRWMPPTWCTGRVIGGVAVGLVLTVAAVVGVVAVVGSAASEPGPAPWRTVLRGLDLRRAQAFGRADPAALTAVYVTGAPAGARDRTLITRLSAQGLHAEGLRLSTRRIKVRRATSTMAVLRVTDVLAPYRLVDGSGAVVRSAAGRRPTTWVLTLRREGTRWKVYDVARR